MTEEKGKALLVMGCPEVPVQTGIVIYLADKLQKAGYQVTVAGTNAAQKLIRVSDPEEHYIKDLADLDSCIADLAEKRRDFDLCFVFMHNDSGMTYGATFSVLSRARLYALVFGKNAEALAETIEYPAEKIVAKAVHNPMPLKNKIDRVIL
ncbi:MAG: DUF1890 domain-containing protein [Methanotrichaceae archaeon]|nr:DUF1890 domain-containing protein [Methanotrichaceae archaeon]